MVEVQRRLLNYRNTPDPSTGLSPASLMFGSRIKTKILQFTPPAEGEVYEKAKKQDKKSRQEKKMKQDREKGPGY